MENRSRTHSRPRTFAEHLSRSVTVAGLAWALVVLYVAPPALLADIGSPSREGDGSALSPTRSHPAWTDAHARRYPGCVGVTGWSTTRRPTAVVVLRRNGDLARMPLAEALRRARSTSAADDVWTVGRCR